MNTHTPASDTKMVELAEQGDDVSVLTLLQILRDARRRGDAALAARTERVVWG